MLRNFTQLPFAGTPANGVNEVQQVSVTGSPTGGTFTLALDGETTAPIAYHAGAAAVQAALEALCPIGPGNVAVSGGAGGPWSVTFQNEQGGKNLSQLTADGSSLTGGTAPAVTVTTTTAGVQGTFRGAQPDAVLVDTVGGALYTNTGSRSCPIWSEYTEVE